MAWLCGWVRCGRRPADRRERSECAAARGAAPGLKQANCGVVRAGLRCPPVRRPRMPRRRAAGARACAADRRPERRSVCAALLMPAKLEVKPWAGYCCCSVRPVGCGGLCVASARLELLPAIPGELQPHLAKVVVRAHDAAAANAVQSRACIPRQCHSSLPGASGVSQSLSACAPNTC